MPLHEIRTAHEGAVLGRAPVVVPEISVDKVNGMRKAWTADGAISTQALHQSFDGVYFVVGCLYHLLRLRVYAVDHSWSMALIADLLHLRLRLGVVRTLRGNRVGKEIGQSLGGIMGHAQSIDAAHVTGSTGGDKHFPRGEFLRLDREVQKVFLRGEHHTMFRFLVDFDL